MDDDLLITMAAGVDGGGACNDDTTARGQCKGRCWDGKRCTARVVGEHMCNGEHFCAAHLVADDVCPLIRCR